MYNAQKLHVLEPYNAHLLFIIIWNSRAADQERARGAEFIEDRKIAKDKVSYMDVPQRPVSVSSAGSDSKGGQKFFLLLNYIQLHADGIWNWKKIQTKISNSNKKWTIWWPWNRWKVPKVQFLNLNHLRKRSKKLKVPTFLRREIFRPSPTGVTGVRRFPLPCSRNHLRTFLHLQQFRRLTNLRIFLFQIFLHFRHLVALRCSMEGLRRPQSADRHHHRDPLLRRAHRHQDPQGHRALLGHLLRRLPILINRYVNFCLTL